MSFLESITTKLEYIYRGLNTPFSPEVLGKRILDLMQSEDIPSPPKDHPERWSEKDAFLITYGNSIQQKEEPPLQTLHHFLDSYVGNIIPGLHILPFFPYSSDEGFAVKDYFSVNPELGDWADINHLAQHRKLMADMVINHASSESEWFKNFMSGTGEGSDFFFTASPETDVSRVIRPRTTPLLRPTETQHGMQYVWCTFSHDQVDFDFRNPEVLLMFVRILRYYLDMGIRVFRLDAVAFVWKEPDTGCINLPQTHAIIQLFHSILKYAQPEAWLITETNIPNKENLSYFGQGNQAHCIYNFSLPPLLLHTMLSGDCRALKHWLKTMPPAKKGRSYFNFIASHDGIGLRPAEGLLTEDQLDAMIRTLSSVGAEISWRSTDSGETKPYEINITLNNAFKTTHQGKDTFGVERHLCAHAILFGLEGIPGLYIHSLLATKNDYHRLKETGVNRSINRHQWDYPSLKKTLAKPGSKHRRIMEQLLYMLEVRSKQPAFHPNATQFTMSLGKKIFGFWRQSLDREQSIFCISNVTAQPVTLKLQKINLTLTDSWTDLLSDREWNPEELNEKMVLQPYQTIWLTNYLV